MFSISTDRTAPWSYLVMSAASLLVLDGPARADMYYWVGKGSTSYFSQRDPVTPSIFRFDPFSAILDEPLGGQPIRALSNLFSPNTPGGTDGTFAPLSSLSSFDFSDHEPTHHLVFANTFHANRTAVLDQLVGVASLQFTTRGDAAIAAAQGTGAELKTVDWLFRWPGCTGILQFDTTVVAEKLWLGGSGEVRFRQDLFGQGQGIVKSGPATMVYDPAPGSPNAPYIADNLVIRNGALILKGYGENLFTAYRVLRIGSEFGGQEGIPTNLPYPGWEPIDINPPAPPPPSVHIQQSNVMDSTNSIRLGHDGSAVFDGPTPIGFYSRIVSDLPGTGAVVKSGGGGTRAELGSATLSDFSGTFRIQSGTLSTYVPPAVCPVSFESGTSSEDAAWEIYVPSGSANLENTYSGLGELRKSGGGTLVLSVESPSFVGDYRVIAGTLKTSQVANRAVLRNFVNVDAGALLSAASENIDDGTYVNLAGGTWNLAGFTETIAGLLLRDDSACSLGNGTLRVAGNVVVFPSGASTAKINAPGTLFLVGPDSRTIDVSPSGAPAGLDIKSSVAGAPLIVTGSGVAQFSGAFNCPSLTIRSGTASLNIPAASAKPASITVGYTDSSNPFAPTARLQLAANDQIPDGTTLSLVNRADFALSGFTDRIGGLNVSGAGPFSVTTSDGVNPGGLDLAGNATFSGGPTTINGGLGLVGQTRTFTLNPGASLTLSGQLFSGRLSKTGSGTLRLDALEAFIPIDLSGATSSVGTATIAGFGGSGTLRIDTALTVNPVANVATSFGGSFTGAGSFTKSGAGQFELSGGAFNSYSGGTRVEGGTLFLNRFPGTTVIPGNATIASGGTLLFAGGASNEIADSADIIVESGGTVDMAGQTETIRSATISGTWTIDSPTGTPGNLTATQSLFVAGGTLVGNVSGGPLNVSVGTAHLRGTVPSAAINLSSTLWVGGLVGSDQLTITGPLSLSTNTSSLKFTTGLATDPPLLRALGSLTLPIFGTIPVKVDQMTPQPVGTAIKLLDCSAGSGNPTLPRFALAAPSAGSGRGQLVLTNRVLSYVVTRNPCAADTNGSGTLSVQDIFDFLSIWFAGNAGADFNQSGQITVQDIFDFLANWFNGC